MADLAGEGFSAVGDTGAGIVLQFGGDDDETIQGAVEDLQAAETWAVVEAKVAKAVDWQQQVVTDFKTLRNVERRQRPAQSLVVRIQNDVSLIRSVINRFAERVPGKNIESPAGPMHDHLQPVVI